MGQADVISQAAVLKFHTLSVRTMPTSLSEHIYTRRPIYTCYRPVEVTFARTADRPRSISNFGPNAVVTCELKLFQNYFKRFIAAREGFPTMLNVAETISKLFQCNISHAIGKHQGTLDVAPWPLTLDDLELS